LFSKKKTSLWGGLAGLGPLLDITRPTGLFGVQFRLTPPSEIRDGLDQLGGALTEVEKKKREGKQRGRTGREGNGKLFLRGQSPLKPIKKGGRARRKHKKSTRHQE